MQTTANHTNQVEKDGLLTVFSLIESLQNPAFIIKPDGWIQAVNSRFVSRIGKTPKACIDHKIFDLLESDSHWLPLSKALEEQCASTLLSGKSSVFEDGSHGWSVTLNPIRADSGAVTSFFVSLQEIARPNESIEKSRSTRHGQLAAALEGTGASVWEWSLKTGELDWFGDACPIFGSEKNQECRSIDRFKESISPDDREKTFRLISEAIKTERALDIEFRVVQPDGSVRWIMMRGKPVYGSNGELDRYLGTA
ncbi:MAG: PAS domain-containing protein, partial [Chlorobaculum sp.]|nr:PAS domain-containing protein [Chlorobaculum sp.]